MAQTPNFAVIGKATQPLTQWGLESMATIFLDNFKSIFFKKNFFFPISLKLISKNPTENLINSYKYDQYQCQERMQKKQINSYKWYKYLSTERVNKTSQQILLLFPSALYLFQLVRGGSFSFDSILNPLHGKFFQREHKHIFTSYVIPPHW